jgi:hypothetical protein
MSKFATDFDHSLEDALRDAAPALPPALKSQTLARCASRVAAKRQREQRRNRMVGCVLCAILATQWLGTALLDGQNERLMTGKGTPPTFSAMTVAQAVELLQNRTFQFRAWLEGRTPKNG